ncbi:hypothetical protein ABT288_25700 [Streptomyces sp. NPDC001093]|uniref:hypothetical protein n=1 Tax=Streptomyces sp. NPDC001093 TaxID=3154376 RepID=UPI00332ACCD6
MAALRTVAVSSAGMRAVLASAARAGTGEAGMACAEAVSAQARMYASGVRR